MIYVQHQLYSCFWIAGPSTLSSPNIRDTQPSKCFSETGEWIRVKREVAGPPCHRLMHVWFDVLWETSAGDVTMTMSCSHPSRGWGPWIINDTRPHQEQYERRSPHRRNKMFPLSIHPSILPPLLPALKTSHHRDQLPSLFCCWWNPLSACLSCVCLAEKGAALRRKRDSMCLTEWRWRVSVWLVNPV